MKFILGRKISMSQIFLPDGRVVPITEVQAGPCFVTQVKNQEKDGVSAVQIGFEETKKELPKPRLGHLKDLPRLKVLKDFNVSATETVSLKRGDKVTVDVFKVGDLITVAGVSKGKGFQGVVKRHHFKGHPTTHGTKDSVRMPGSIGAGGVQRVFKGMRMAGHMGSDNVTIKNLEIVGVDADKNILQIKGALPGSRGSLVEIYAL
jgi:large subunit ribosomal protein L3